jgi:multiple sugar transport system substrate-binding protein
MNAPDRSRPSDPMHRRTFLRTAGAIGATAGLEGVLAARRAPALAQVTKIHLLQWVDFIPEGDVEVKRQVAEYNKQMKVEVVFETINANDLQARITAAIQSGSGPDIIMMLHNWPHLYAGGLADVSDL